jgi:hypothetical protein
MNRPAAESVRDLSAYAARWLAAWTMVMANVQAIHAAEPRHVSDEEMRAAKHGRVLDVDSGAGIPGVKVIVNFRGSTTGSPGFTGGGAWCNLQKVVTTDANGDFTIPDVSKELDLSSRGTHGLGLMSATNDTDWVLSTFKPGYVRVSDIEGIERAKQGKGTLQTVPDAHLRSGKAEVAPIAMRRLELAPADLWIYYGIIASTGLCTDRMAKDNETPEIAEILESIRKIVRPMPCAMTGDTAIAPEAFNQFQALSHDGRFNPPFVERVKILQGGQPPARGFDPTERVATTAGVLCRALKEEDDSK